MNSLLEKCEHNWVSYPLGEFCNSCHTIKLTMHYAGGGVGWEAAKSALCECGSEKCKLPTHSTWCPKYEAP